MESKPAQSSQPANRPRRRAAISVVPVNAEKVILLKQAFEINMAHNLLTKLSVKDDNNERKRRRKKKKSNFTNDVPKMSIAYYEGEIFKKRPKGNNLYIKNFYVSTSTKQHSRGLGPCGIALKRYFWGWV